MSSICIGLETLLNRSSGTCHGECNRYRYFRLTSLKIVLLLLLLVMIPTNRSIMCNGFNMFRPCHSVLRLSSPLSLVTSVASAG